jgi:hypothetical protein
MSAPIQPSELRLTGETARVVIVNCHSLLRHKYRRFPLWSLVGDITGHGSGYSIEVCKSAGLDPNQLCGGQRLIRTSKPEAIA